MKKIIKISIFVLLAGLFIFTLFFLYKRSEKKEIVYKTTKAEYRDIIKKTVATGTVVPRREIVICPRVSGIIEELYIEPGDKIEKGSLIAKIKIIPNILNLSNAEASVKQAEISLNDKKIVFDRQKNLLENEVISKAEFQQTELDYKLALQALEAAENNLQIIKEGIAKETGTATNTLVRSTITGMVLDVPVEIGTSVIETNTFNAGTTIASVADMGDMIFEGKVDETEVGKLKIGMELILNIGAIDNYNFKASLTHIAPKGILENGAIQFEIKANVKLIDSIFIRAGYSANADIVLDRKNKVLSIEEKNLIFEKEEIFLEKETTPNVFTKVKVKTGLSDGIYTEIFGINDKDKIKIIE